MSALSAGMATAAFRNPRASRAVGPQVAVVVHLSRQVGDHEPALSLPVLVEDPAFTVGVLAEDAVREIGPEQGRPGPEEELEPSEGDRRGQEDEQRVECESAESPPQGALWHVMPAPERPGGPRPAMVSPSACGGPHGGASRTPRRYHRRRAYVSRHHGRRAMRTKSVLTASDVHKMVAACKAEASKNSWNVTIAVVDDASHL